MRKNIFLFLIFCFFSLTVWANLFRPSILGNESLPTLTGRVVDNAGILDVKTENKISAILESLEPDQVVVATVSYLNGKEIEEYALQLARYWGIGEKEKDNGILFLIAPNERQTRIEVGYGLEGTLSDVLAHNIIRKKVLPYFKRGDYQNGILSGVQAIATHLNGSVVESEKPISLNKSEPMPLGIMIFLGIFVFFFVLISFLILKEIFSSGKGTKRRSGYNTHNIPSINYGRSKRSSTRTVFRGRGGRFGGGGSSGRW